MKGSSFLLTIFIKLNKLYLHIRKKTDILLFVEEGIHVKANLCG